MEKPLVSIIIPTYNRAHLIGETLDSLLAQTYTNWECIIVDDGSTDNTAELLKTYCEKDTRFKYVRRPDTHKSGGNGARNYGLAKSKGDYFMFLDSDDLLSHYSIQNRVNLSDTNKLAKVLVFKMQHFIKKVGDHHKIVNRYFLNKEEYLMKFLSHELPWPISALFLKREMAFVSFNEDLHRFQDVEYAIKLLLGLPKNNFLVLENIKPDCYYRVSEDARYKSISFFKNLTNSLLVYLKSVDVLIKNCENSKKYKEANYVFFKKMYKFYILPNIRHLKSEVKPLKVYLKNSCYFNKGYFIKLTILEFLHNYNMHKRKGMGVYRLTKLWLDGRK